MDCSDLLQKFKSIKKTFDENDSLLSNFLVNEKLEPDTFLDKSFDDFENKIKTFHGFLQEKLYILNHVRHSEDVQLHEKYENLGIVGGVETLGEVIKTYDNNTILFNRISVSVKEDNKIQLYTHENNKTIPMAKVEDIFLHTEVVSWNDDEILCKVEDDDGSPALRRVNFRSGEILGTYFKGLMASFNPNEFCSVMLPGQRIFMKSLDVFFYVQPETGRMGINLGNNGVQVYDYTVLSDGTCISINKDNNTKAGYLDMIVCKEEWIERKKIDLEIFEGKEVNKMEVFTVNKDFLIIEGDELSTSQHHTYFVIRQPDGAWKAVRDKENRNFRIMGSLSENRFLGRSGRELIEYEIRGENIIQKRVVFHTSDLKAVGLGAGQISGAHILPNNNILLQTKNRYYLLGKKE